MANKFLNDFKNFAMKGNVLDMAVGVIIGGAFGKIVSSVVADVIMPPIGLLVGGVNFTDLKWTMKDAVPELKDEAGNVTAVHCTADLESGNGNPVDGRKVKGTIHWVSCASAVDADARLYNALFTEANMNGIPDDADFKDYLNPASVTVMKNAKLEESLADAKPGEKFQFVRMGYFTPDSKKPGAFNRIVTLKDSFTKTMKK